MDINNLNTSILELLKLRGITSKEDIYDFFFQDIYSLSNPFNIRDINVFVDRVKEAIENDEKILIYGDKDADGITAASIIYNTLKMVTKNVEAFVPNHTTGYGLSKAVIEEYANSGISLIITVDCGISNAEEVEFARDLSIDIIVTDHHDIPEILPNAYAVFNPKISNTGFVSKNFSGCAVAFKLMQAFVFSYTKLYNKDIIVLDYEIDRSKNVLKRIRALKSTNFVISDEVFGFELINSDNRYKSIYADYYDELMSEDEVLEELASYMFEGDGCVLVLTGGEDRLKRLIHLYGKYEIYLPEYDNVYDLLQLGAKYGNVNIKTTKTLDDFALALNVNIYRYDNIEYRDLIIKMEIFRRLFYISQKQLHSYIKKKSILVLFGSVADVVPLIEENRAYVKCALKELEKPSHIRYNIILERINLLNTKIDTQAISWRLAPFINAAGRMGSPETALKLLTCEIKEEALTLSNEVYNMNETRKSLTESNFTIVNEYIKANSCLDLPIIVVKSKKIEQGLTGLIAGKVLSEYGKTAVIMHESDEGICIGSIRSRGEDNARDMLEYANIYLTKFGGHKNAAGFTLNTDNFEKFQSKIIKYASNQNFQTEKNDDVFDMELSFKEIDIKFARLLELFEPYGCGNEEPLFMSKKVKVNSINKMKKNNKIHLRLELLQDNKKVNAIMWDKSDEEADKLLSSDYIDIIYKLKVNRFGGSEDARIYIESYKIF
ncbi:single-stranded-DNA-specific exonuclease RecJ [Brachyspira hampsonii]|uniref:Single-stranded-DNA-specific exonuclease RecJ n=1 Tax=Brachyspira hampsonii TaxID=1287055 RepID=A0AAC9XKC5_9SPIR|nr:single-stranded-DNA-specific exonuclease RecJ [Brachyspira hampsonii]ASJ21266.1 single-stranded-DNA-specific exonuclease RecJ [Brachyspira hampsonii]MBW5379580.1 single-stranded-DNA-specific exonuclease RecJ [Brachyspira hampsonii]MBW5410956.1 single-stranded-DNA-specific exonuclease RecJ [Brachyspira hampsonii]OEJ18681.1 single-stranded-DNA-specific exonuclease RecJ [Brachyspira hampsonii]